MPPKSNVPIRIGGSKVRTGCRTCKKRHVKCDEGRPVCFRCQRADRLCIYENPQFQDMSRTTSMDQPTGAVVPRNAQRSSPQPFMTMIKDVSPYGSHDVVEVMALKSFTLHLSKDLSGCFDDKLWRHVLPRVAQHEPAIWHAMVAVSLLDKNMRLGDGNYRGDRESSLALMHYDKAIQELKLRIASIQDTDGKDVVLLSCILFAIFDCLRRNVAASLRHISSGMKLLVEWDYEALSNNSNRTVGYVTRKDLLPFFLSLDSQAIQMGVVDFRDDFSLPAMNDQFQIPESFATLEDAHLSLNHIFNRISHWANWIEPSEAIGRKPDAAWMAAERERLQTQITKWNAAFDLPFKLLYPQPGILLLLVQMNVMQAFFDKQTDGPSEMTWDKYLPRFETAVEHAELYMELTESNYQANAPESRSQFNPSEQPRQVFTVAMDIVLSLFLISMKCRVSDVRRKALKMLRLCGRKEGIWDSYQCSKLAEKAIQLEEAHALEDGFIPETARIVGLDVRVDSDMNGEVTYRKLVPGVDGYYRVQVYREAVTVT